MGGGARAMAKVAGMAAAPTAGGLRSLTAEHFSFSSAARKAASGRPSVAAAADDVNLVASNSESVVRKQSMEFDDWVFPVVEEEMAVANPMPRVVFAGVPDLQEAKEATSELSLALEKTFLSSPKPVGYEECADSKASLSSEIVDVPAVPSPAIMAFKFLHESSVAKDVVASIACDPNVWNAMLQNQDLQKFLQSQRACVVCTDNNVNVEEFDGDAKSSDGSEGWNRFRDFFENMKRTVVNMLNSLSDYFKDLFGGKGINGDTVMERSFMGLAVMVILVILLKRP